MKIVEQTACSIIVPSELPDTDYVINPYVGCSFACAYCYASFMGRFVGEAREAWGKYVYVKTNAVELFRRDIAGRRFDSEPALLMSSVTDAWQGPERKYRLARGILAALVDRGYGGRVSLLTKSPLIWRDADLLKQLPRVEIGLTVTTDDDVVGAVYEARAPRNSDRLDHLRRLSDRGLTTYAFLGPLMTHYVDRPETIDALVRQVKESGVRFAYAELLNVSHPLMTRLKAEIAPIEGRAEEFARQQADPDRRARLAQLVVELFARHGLELRLGYVMDHSAPDRSRAAAGIRHCQTP
jgi:DNA repair photolyase